MLKRIKIKELAAGNEFFINGRRFKVYGRVMREGQVFVCAYQEKPGNTTRKLNFLQLDMEVMINA